VLRIVRALEVLVMVNVTARVWETAAVSVTTMEKP
jgi:hypothetical protein